MSGCILPKKSFISIYRWDGRVESDGRSLSLMPETGGLVGYDDAKD